MLKRNVARGCLGIGAFTIMALCLLVMKFGNVHRRCDIITYGECAFKEKTLCDNDTIFHLDVDFDEVPDSVRVMDGNVAVGRFDQKTQKYQIVSKQVPYCWLAIHRCCPAHKAFTTFDYINKTIYIEAHYGSSDKRVRQFKKIGDGWEEVIPVMPMSVLNELLYPHSHLIREVHGRRIVWCWRRSNHH